MTATPLEPWIKTKICLPATQPLTRFALENYQLRKLQETVAYARQHSPFYRSLLQGVCDEEFTSLADIARLPFTTAAELREDELRFLCVSQGEIERVVTLNSSGTTAPPKRLHFTAEDLELTVDFFHHGMSTLVKPDERVLILMPGELPGSVGDLLVKGLGRMNVAGIVHGLVRDAGEVLDRIAAEEIDCLVGLPVQVLALARHPNAARLAPGRLKSILLSADYVPAAVVRELTAVFGAAVFNHYGMTEMGLGGGVECRHLCGYHLREADLFFEVVDPESGHPLPEGELGEVVFSTLTRRGMPLIRYRTGDLARFLPDPCPCGTVLRRLERVRGRLAGEVRLGNGYPLNITELDEALFTLPFLLDYQPMVSSRDGQACLDVAIETREIADEDAAALVRRALLEVRAVRRAVAEGRLVLGTVGRGAFARSISIKRTVIDQRKEQPC
jgi:phenylacetate-coenzyme A ligase PaaK-like adenylate-forming protein